MVIDMHYPFACGFPNLVEEEANVRFNGQIMKLSALFTRIQDEIKFADVYVNVDSTGVDHEDIADVPIY